MNKSRVHLVICGDEVKLDVNSRHMLLSDLGAPPQARLGITLFEFYVARQDEERGRGMPISDFDPDFFTATKHCTIADGPPHHEKMVSGELRAEVAC